MMCPICGGKDLKDMKEVKFGPDPYDYSKLGKDERDAEKPAAISKQSTAPLNTSSSDLTCPICKFNVQKGWKFCPECGVKFSFS
jgi:RNA polymerase subunit RPABC4/transcription elongation factor Spt4